jgi:molybdopterin-guanine dinucleotide biosynthesis protein A
VPKKLATVPRLIDIPGVNGPLAGFLAAGRWHPLVSWLLVACDMPYVTAEAVSWLTEARHAGWWGCVPKLSGKERVEPLFAWYDFRAMHLFEEQILQGSLRLSDTAGDFRMEHPTVPEELCHCWQNINTPEDLSLVQW